MRPFIYRIAKSNQIFGTVRNSESGVLIEAEAEPDKLNNFLAQARSGTPNSTINEIEVNVAAPLGWDEFRIIKSESRVSRKTIPPVDIATCENCWSEFADPNNRRFQYPLITCAECGPRFSILNEMPFERESTAMAEFTLCDSCRHEFEDPSDRRFHAQTISCIKCGPKNSWHSKNDVETNPTLAINKAIQSLANGGVIAIKNIGGYQLMCDATRDESVERVRDMKQREDKPFALVARNVEIISKHAKCNEKKIAVLNSRERPIVILEKSHTHSHDKISEYVSPGCSTVGFQLPNSPLIEILLDSKPYVLTSANLSGFPITIDDSEAITKLGTACDGILSHNRDIITRCDDSVIQYLNDEPIPIRRSRGFSPKFIELPNDGPTVLAVGSEGKASLGLAIGKQAYLSAHIGEIENLESLIALKSASEHFCNLFKIKPDIIVSDSHPGYLSRKFAQELASQLGAKFESVSHHRAHAESLILDRDLENERVLVFCYDGTGYGEDGSVWGGEVFIRENSKLSRVATMTPVPMPGGEIAVMDHSRMALAYLWSAGLECSNEFLSRIIEDKIQRNIIWTQLNQGFNCPKTSSVGRLFDAVCAIIGIRNQSTYEAQAAIELESIADEFINNCYPWKLSNPDILHIDTSPVISSILENVNNGVPKSVIAGRFLHTIADIIAQICIKFRNESKIDQIGFTGGVFQNAKLCRITTSKLRADGFTIHQHRSVPPNDDGIALGQIGLVRQRCKTKKKF